MRNKVNKKQSLPVVKNNEVEDSMIEALDDLAAYETFQLDMPKELRRALIDKLPPDEIYKKFANVAAARIVQIIATEKDSGKALAAAREVLDRTFGKAIERKQVRHQFEELSDQELDAVLLSELDEES
jgi:hypothetical protein